LGALDVGDPAAIPLLADAVGDIDILVNNAGFSVWGATDELGVADFDGMFAANVRGPYYLVAAFAPGMAARGAGSIVNIGSISGSVGLPGAAAYGATKAALAALTRSWAAEFSASGVRVNTVAPGPIYTRPEAVTCSINSVTPPRPNAPPSPRRSPNSSPSSPPPGPATSPAPPSPSTAAAPPSRHPGHNR
jgi:NAD(P)-dependent dehydrogenase (short-subunit alcohol dehydrogenase family)